MALKRSLHISIAVLFAAGAACAESREMTSDEFGTHNPEELTLHGALDRLEHGESHPMEYAMGYFAAKAGLHDEAKRLFEGAVEEFASPQGMTWLSWMADNGLAGQKIQRPLPNGIAGPPRLEARLACSIMA